MPKKGIGYKSKRKTSRGSLKAPRKTNKRKIKSYRHTKNYIV